MWFLNLLRFQFGAKCLQNFRARFAAPIQRLGPLLVHGSHVFIDDFAVGSIEMDKGHPFLTNLLDVGYGVLIRHAAGALRSLFTGLKHGLLNFGRQLLPA